MAGMELRWLSLETKRLEPARAFYTDALGMEVVRESETECVVESGDACIILRVPSDVPRGGLHVHYALSVPRDEYDFWKKRLDFTEERDFGGYRSIYFYDPAGNCVEIGESDGSGDGIVGVFELVLEVEDLERATEFYTALGATVRDTGDDRERVRLDAGGFDIELWEPQLGIADGQGGVHVDFGVGVEKVGRTVSAVENMALSSESTRDGIRLCDPDDHYVTVS